MSHKVNIKKAGRVLSCDIVVYKYDNISYQAVSRNVKGNGKAGTHFWQTPTV